MKKITGAISLVVITLFGCASVATKQETYVAKEVIDVPSKYNLQQVVKKTEETIGVRATNIQKFVGFMPEDLPDKPAHPKFSMKDIGFGLGSITFATISCGDKAVATISGQEPELKNPYGTAEISGYKACIYPYKNGYRIYIFGTYIKQDSNGLGGFFTRIIETGVSKIACNNMPIFNCWWKQIVEKSKQEFADGKIIEVEYPIK